MAGINGEEMFGAFEAAGHLAQVTWISQDGGTRETKFVHLSVEDVDTGAGESGVLSRERTMKFPISYFPGIKHGDSVTIEKGDYAGSYFVRNTLQENRVFNTAQIGLRK